MNQSVGLSAKKKIAIVYGGVSTEHDVSLRTAQAVINELDRGQYILFPVYIDRCGEWNIGEGPLERKIQDSDELTSLPASDSSTVCARLQTMDIVFPLLHGTNGEDGTIQGFLEILGVPYVGCGVLASAVGLDKVVMKQIFQANGLPQCRWVSATHTQWKRSSEEIVQNIEQQLGYPCFVKPACGGSSIGITRVTDRSLLYTAIETVWQHDTKMIIEEAVTGREIEVGCLGNADVRTSVVGEIRCAQSFYDYEAKYASATTRVLVPAPLDADVANEAKQLAVRAFEALGARGLARVDFFYCASKGTLWINEVNTMPGFTPQSMFPQLWIHTGMTYSDLLNELIQLALEEPRFVRDGFSTNASMTV